MAFKKNNKKKTLREDAFNTIKNMIITMELEPGTRLEEKYLCSMLSMGRTPIREALLRLSVENLIERHDRGGIYVKEITLKSVRDFYEALFYVERAIAEKAPQRITKKDIASLENINQQLKKAVKNKNYIDIILLNGQFHKLIAQATENYHLIQYEEALRNEGQRLAYISIKNLVSISNSDYESHYKNILEDHQKMIHCLQKQDSESLTEIITEHNKTFQLRTTHFLTNG